MRSTSAAHRSSHARSTVSIVDTGSIEWKACL
jgi:hypothetical protein